MATATGTFSGRTNHQLRLEVVVSSQNIGGNTSTLYWELWVDRTSGTGTWSSNVVGNWLVNIDGQQIGGGGWNYDTRTNPNKILGSGYVTVGHAADGSKAVGFSAGANSSSTLGSANTNGGVLYPPTIPRASNSTISPNPVAAGAALTITTNRASSGFTHTITWAFGSASGTVATGVGASYVWTVPLSLMNQIPSATSGTGTITTITYNGGTQIGSTSRSFTVTVPTSVVPTLSDVTHSETVSIVSTEVGAYVQNLSKLALAIVGAAGAYGSTITAYKLTIAGQTINAASGTTAALAQSGNLNLVATVTDSRGRQASITEVVPVMAYSAPAITTADLTRALAGGTPDEEGTTIRVDLIASVPSLINGTQRNALTYRISTRERGTNTWAVQNTTPLSAVGVNTSVLISSYSLESSWEVRVEIYDKFSLTSVIGTIATGTVLMHLDEEAVGIGKFAENGMLDVKGQIFQNNGEPIQPSGLISAFAGATPPVGWRLCDGSYLDRTTYASLFAVIGTQYGSTTSSNFRIPDYRGRFLLGLDPSDATHDTLNEAGGAKTHVLTAAELPPHEHQAGNAARFVRSGGVRGDGGNANIPVTGSSYVTDSFTGIQAGTTGQPHNNMPPYRAVNYIIKL